MATLQLKHKVGLILNVVQAATQGNLTQEMQVSGQDPIGQLADSSLEIGKVVNVITSIAEQTNLLALNATVEIPRSSLRKNSRFHLDRNQFASANGLCILLASVSIMKGI